SRPSISDQCSPEVSAAGAPVWRRSSVVSGDSPWMNSAPSSTGAARAGSRRVQMRPPIRSRASRTRTERPALPSAAAAARPAAPAPITMTSGLSVPIALPLCYRNDDARTPPVAPVSLGPVDEHDQAVAKADQEIDVRRQPDPPGEQS